MLLIGRTPIVSSRLRSHQGLSPTLTPEMTRAVNRGQRSRLLDGHPGLRLDRRAGGRRPRVGHAEGLVEQDRDLARDADMAQAIGTVARDLQVDGDVAADVGDRFEVQARQGQPLGQGLHRHVEPEVVGQPVPAHDHRECSVRYRGGGRRPRRGIAPGRCDCGKRASPRFYLVSRSACRHGIIRARSRRARGGFSRAAIDPASASSCSSSSSIDDQGNMGGSGGGESGGIPSLGARLLPHEWQYGSQSLRMCS